jgi:hypothetical protein
MYLITDVGRSLCRCNRIPPSGVKQFVPDDKTLQERFPMAGKLFARLFVAIIIASIWTGSASVASAQQTTEKPKRSAAKADVIAAGDSVSIADVQRAAEQLAAAVQAAVKKATEDPALKVAALKVATNAVNAAQVVVTQQAATLQTVLDSLAKEIAVATEKQTKAKTH